MSRTKVLIVDDSLVMRKMLSDVIAEEIGIDVVGTAANGKIALRKVKALEPDVVTMDIEMPDMNGIEAVEAIRGEGIDVPIIMFSTLSEHGAEATLKALSLGANDYVTKPANVGSVTESIGRIRAELVPKILSLDGKKGRVSSRTGVQPIAEPPAPILRAPGRGTLPPADLVCIGSSTGGPNALEQVIKGLPANLEAPIVIVQHMPKIFTRLLANRLNDLTPFAVSEAEQGTVLQKGHVYVAPGDLHLRVEKVGSDMVCRLSKEEPINSCRPAVDPFFESASTLRGKQVLGVVLTGMGQDGLEGARILRDQGAEILVQDEATSVVWGMPGAIAKAGLADEILPLQLIANTIERRVQRDVSLTRS